MQAVNLSRPEDTSVYATSVIHIEYKVAFIAILNVSFTQTFIVSSFHTTKILWHLAVALLYLFFLSWQRWISLYLYLNCFIYSGVITLSMTIPVACSTSWADNANSSDSNKPRAHIPSCSESTLTPNAGKRRNSSRRSAWRVLTQNARFLPRTVNALIDTHLFLGL